MAWPGIFKAAAVFTFLAFFFQVAGIALPWWFVLGDTVYLGVWYLVLCWGGGGLSGNCSVIGFSAAAATGEKGADIGTYTYILYRTGIRNTDS